MEIAKSKRSGKIVAVADTGVINGHKVDVTIQDHQINVRIDDYNFGVFPFTPQGKSDAAQFVQIHTESPR